MDFATDPHFLLFGDVESGKSRFLRALAATITRRMAPEQARIILVDYRRSLLGAVPESHLIGYGIDATTTAGLVEQLASALQHRLPGPAITPQQLRDRSWWSGPECFVLVDDYDLVATGSSNPLASLLEYLPQARDIGWHLVLARRSGGAGRALFEPVIQRMVELSSPGLVMSGTREEGPLIGGVRPRPLPPGRGWLVTRKQGSQLVQLAHLPPPDVDLTESPRGGRGGQPEWITVLPVLAGLRVSLPHHEEVWTGARSARALPAHRRPARPGPAGADPGAHRLRGRRRAGRLAREHLLTPRPGRSSPPSTSTRCWTTGPAGR